MKKEFYKNKKSYLICGLIGIVGILYIIGAIFLNSVTTLVDIDDRVTDGLSLWDSIQGGLRELKYGFAVYKVVPLLLFIILVIVAIFMAGFVIHDNFLNPNMREDGEEPKRLAIADKIDAAGGVAGFMRDFIQKHKYIARLLPAVLIILLYILLYHTRSYKNDFQSVTELVTSWKSIINQYSMMGVDTDMVAEIHKGLAVLVRWLGIIFYLGAFAFNFVLDTLNEEE